MNAARLEGHVASLISSAERVLAKYRIAECEGCVAFDVTRMRFAEVELLAAVVRAKRELAKGGNAVSEPSRN